MRDLTPSAKKATDIIAGLILLAAAIVIVAMAVSGCSELSDVWLLIVLSSLFCVFLFTAIYQRNPVALWLCGIVIAPLVVEIAVLCGLSYATVYPVYIAAPAIAFMLTGMFFKRRSLIISATLFIFADIFVLEACSIVSIAIVLPIAVIYLIVATVSLIITERKR